jgi:hypothetical protein
MSENQSKAKPQQVAADAKAKYQPTKKETAALSKYREHSKGLAPRLKVDKSPGRINIDHPDPVVGSVVLMEALGTADPDFFDGLLHQLSINSFRAESIDQRTLNFMLAVIKGIKPRDQLEAMLAAQMAAVHDAIMAYTRQLANANNILHQDSAERALNKLARTFTTQMEALQRYRNGGEQTVTVQQVSVSDGGQAIVGNVSQSHREAGQGPPKNAPPVIPFEPRPVVAVIDPDGARKPIPIERIHTAQTAQSKK